MLQKEIKRLCNICGNSFNSFNIVNKEIAPREAQCPECGSLERHRHLFVHIAAIWPFLKGKKILHFAPEKIIKNIIEQSEADYYDADLFMNDVRYKVDITDIPFKNNFFDYIFCVHVLEHIENDMQAMSELHRVLRRDGTAFLCVPLHTSLEEDLTIDDRKMRAKLYGQEDHVRNYDLVTFKERLLKSGFNVDQISDFSSPPYSLKYALLGDIIVLARKK